MSNRRKGIVMALTAVLTALIALATSFMIIGGSANTQNAAATPIVSSAEKSAHAAPLSTSGDIMPASIPAGSDNSHDTEHPASEGWHELTETSNGSTALVSVDGKYFLKDGGTYNKGLEFDFSEGDVTICLNGQTFDFSTDGWTIPSGITLHLCDCGDGSIIGDITVEGGSLELESVSVDSVAVTDGGSLTVTNDANVGSISVDGGSLTVTCDDATNETETTVGSVTVSGSDNEINISGDPKISSVDMQDVEDMSDGGSSITVSGSPTIGYNGGDGITLPNDGKITCGDLTTGADILIHADDTGERGEAYVDEESFDKYNDDAEDEEEEDTIDDYFKMSDNSSPVSKKIVVVFPKIGGDEDPYRATYSGDTYYIKENISFAVQGSDGAGDTVDLNSGEYTVNDIDSITDAGTYSFTVSLTGDGEKKYSLAEDIENYEFSSGEATREYIIDKAPLTVKFDDLAAVYNGADWLSTIKGENDGNVYFSFEGLQNGEELYEDDYEITIVSPDDTSEMVDAGTYTVSVTLNDTGEVAKNYRLVEKDTSGEQTDVEEVTNNYTVEKATLKVDWGDKGYQTDGGRDLFGDIIRGISVSAQTSVGSTISLDYTITAKAGTGTGGSYQSSIQIEAAGGYTFKVGLGPNYKFADGSAEATHTFTVAETVTAAWTDSSKTYRYTNSDHFAEIKGNIKVTKADGTNIGESSSDGYTVTALNVTSAGTYKITVTLHGNYKFPGGAMTNDGLSVTVTRAQLTIKALEYVYNGTDQFGTVSGDIKNNISNALDPSVLPSTSGLKINLVTEREIKDVKTYTVTVELSAADSQNFEFASGSQSTNVSVTVKQGVVTGIEWAVTEPAAGALKDNKYTADYDGKTHTVSATLTLNGDPGHKIAAVLAGNTFKDVTAGYTITVGETANYTVSAANATFTATINKKALTLKAGSVSVSKTYDGTGKVESGELICPDSALDGIVGGDTVTIKSKTAEFSDFNVGSGKSVTITVTLDDNSAKNYTISAQTLNVGVITPAHIKSISWKVGSADAQHTYTYDGAQHTLTATGTWYKGDEEGEAQTITLSVMLGGSRNGNFKDKGAYNFTAEIAGNNNLELGAGVSAAFTITVDPAALSVVVAEGKTIEKTYDAETAITVSSDHLTLVGVKGADNVTIVSASGNFNDKNVGENKEITLTITLGGTAVGNYTIAVQKVNGKINKATIDLPSSLGNKTFDGAELTATELATLNGKKDEVLVLDRDYSVKYEAAGYSEAHATNAGEYTVTVTLDPNSALAGNYEIGVSATPLKFTIDRAEAAAEWSADGEAIEVTDGNYSTTYDGEDHTVKLKLSVGSYSVTLTPNIEKYREAKSYTFTATDTGGNFTEESWQLTVTVGKAELTITGATVAAKTYDGTTTANVTAMTFSGFKGSDEDSVQFDEYKAEFKSANASDGDITVTISEVTLKGLAAGNYTVKGTYETSGRIGKANITLSGTYSGSKVYDGSVYSEDEASGGTIEAEADNGLPVSVTVHIETDGADAQTYENDDLSITHSGYDSINYIIKEDTVVYSVEIGKATIKLSGTYTDSKVYDGDPYAKTVRGAENGLKVEMTPADISFSIDITTDGSAAQTYEAKIDDDSVTYNKTNYKLENTAEYSIEIKRAGITVSGSYSFTKTYDGEGHREEIAASAASSKGLQVETEDVTFKIIVSLTVADHGTYANGADGKVAVTYEYDSANYNAPSDSATYTVTIDKAKLTISALGEYTYNKENRFSEVEAAIQGNVTNSLNPLVKPESVTVTPQEIKNAATYSVAVELTEDDYKNFEFGGSRSTSVTVVVKQAQVTSITWHITEAAFGALDGNAYTAFYDGKTHTITATVNFNGGSEEATIDGDSTFKDVDDSDVFAIAESGNFDFGGVATTLTVTVNKAQLTIADLEYTYNKENQSERAKGDIERNIANSSGTSVLPAGKLTITLETETEIRDVKKYSLTVELSEEDFANFAFGDGRSTTVTVEIKQAKVTGITWDITDAADSALDGDTYTAVYDGKTHTITATVNFDGGSEEATIDGNSTFKDVCTRAAFAIVESGNFDFGGVTTTLTVTITKAQIVFDTSEIDITRTRKTYDGDTSVAEVGSGKHITVDGVNSEELNGTYNAVYNDKNVKSATEIIITLTLEGASNYEFGASENYSKTEGNVITWRIAGTITEKELTLKSSEISVTKAYDGTGEVASGELICPDSALDGIVGGDTVTISAKTAEFVGDFNVGSGKSVKITVTLGGADAENYTISAQTLSVGKITSAHIKSIEWKVGSAGAQHNYTYDGAEHTLTATGTWYKGDDEEGEAQTIDLSVMLGKIQSGKFKDKGTYDFTAEIADNNNLEFATDVSAAFTITVGKALVSVGAPDTFAYNGGDRFNDFKANILGKLTCGVAGADLSDADIGYVLIKDVSSSPYTLTVTLSEEDFVNFEFSGETVKDDGRSIEVKVTLAKAKVTSVAFEVDDVAATTLSGDTYAYTAVYDGKSHTVKATVSFDGGSESAAFVGGSSAFEHVADSGEFTAKATDNYDIPADVVKTLKVTVNKAQLTIDDLVYTYDREDRLERAKSDIESSVKNALNPYVLPKEKLTITLEDGSEIREAKTYSLTVKLSDGDFADFTFTEGQTTTVSVTVGKAKVTSIEWNVSSAAAHGLDGDTYTAVYDGEPHTITATINFDGGSEEATIDGNSTFKDVCTRAAFAIVESGNFDFGDVATTLTVTVTKAQLTVEDLEDYVYNGTDQFGTVRDDIKSNIANSSGTTVLPAGELTITLETESEIKDVKTYSVTVGLSAADFKNFEFVSGGQSTSVSVKVKQGVVTGIEWAVTEPAAGALKDNKYTADYDGKSHTVSATLTLNDSGYTVVVEFDSDVIKDADDYTMTVTGTANYTVSASNATFTAQISPYKITGLPTLGNATFNGHVQKAEVLATLNGVNGEVLKLEENDYTVTYKGNVTEDSEPINADTYTVTVTLRDTAKAKNYKLSSDTAEYIIEKAKLAKPSSTIPTVEGDYKGTEYTIEVNGYESDTMTASSDRGSQFDNKNFTATDAGEYNLTITLKYPENYEWDGADKSDPKFTITIEKANNGWQTEPGISGWTYGEDAQEPTGGTATFGGQAKFTYSDSEDGSYNDVKPTNAGDYWMKAEVAGTDNYNVLVKKVQFTIERATLTFALKSDSITGKYSGAGHSEIDVDFSTLQSGDELEKGTHYTLSFEPQRDTTAELDVAGLPKDVGKYTVTVELHDVEAAKNYKMAEGASAVYTVEKAELEKPTCDEAENKLSGVYRGTPYEIEVTGFTSATMTAELSDKDKSSFESDKFTATNAGEYTLKITITDQKNYKWTDGDSDGAVTFTINIDKAELTISGATVDPKIYDGTTTANVTAMTFTGFMGSDEGKVEFDSCVAEFESPNANVNATVEITAVTIKGEAAGNYTVKAPHIVSGVINKADLTVTVSDNNKTYNGETQKAAVTVTGINKQPLNEDGYTVTYKLGGTGDDVDPLNAGAYHIYIALKGDCATNYNEVTVEDELTISPATVGVSWSGYEDLEYNGGEQDITATATGVKGEKISLTIAYSAGAGSALSGSGKPQNAGDYMATTQIRKCAPNATKALKSVT